jgi:hypothetical protein
MDHVFARRTFTWGGIYGFIVLFPNYFLEAKMGRDFPPEINHPELYYGFIGVALAWQVLFVILGSDPVRYRPMMIPAALEKAGWGIAGWVLFALGRVHPFVVFTGSLDLVLMLLFLESYRRTGKPAA